MKPYLKALTITSLLSGGVTAALAESVDFSTTTTTSCTLSSPNNGSLALSTDGQTLGSEESGGSSGSIAILSAGSNTITVEDDDGDAGAYLQAKPVAYLGTPAISVKYSGAGGLNTVDQDYTTASTSFAVGVIPLSVLTLHAKAVDAASFPAGTYTIRTIITCAAS